MNIATTDLTYGADMKDRMLSGGVSIGLGLALETIFGVSDRIDDKRKIPDKVDIDDYDYHIYNLHSVIRHVVASFQKPNEQYAEKDLMEYVVYDINRISEYYKDSSCEPILAIFDYSDKIRIFNKNKIVKKKTKHQIELILVNELVKKWDYAKKVDMATVKEKGFDFKDAKLLLTSSMLLDYAILGKVDMLEAHTGKLIKPHRVNKKYKKLGSEDYSHLPYSTYIHRVLGDSTYILPATVLDRKELMDIGKNWTAVTTDGAIKASILRSKNLRDYIR